KVGKFPWQASGRAIANGRDEGFTKLIFDDATHRIIGGGIVGTHAGDLISEVALAIEMGADAVDIGKTIHPHPTLGESIGMAAEGAHGTCTDLPPQRKKARFRLRAGHSSSVRMRAARLICFVQVVPYRALVFVRYLVIGRWAFSNFSPQAPRPKRPVPMNMRAAQCAGQIRTPGVENCRAAAKRSP